MCGRTGSDWQELRRYATTSVIIRAKLLYVIQHHALKTYYGLQVQAQADSGRVVSLATNDKTQVSIGWKGGGTPASDAVKLNSVCLSRELNPDPCDIQPVA